jgi:ribosomal protein L7/L12
MKYTIETPEEAFEIRLALKQYEYLQYGWEYCANKEGLIAGIQCYRFLNDCGLLEAKKVVEEFLSKESND